jgi:hypothetical protein
MSDVILTFDQSLNGSLPDDEAKLPPQARRD